MGDGLLFLIENAATQCESAMLCATEHCRGGALKLLRWSGPLTSSSVWHSTCQC